MSNVLLLGGSGQVGLAVQRAMPAGTALTAPSSNELDLRDREALRQFVVHCAPTIIINCAAFTRVDDAETERDDAFAINATAPAVLAEAAAHLNARFVHVSTDYVFDGAGGAPYLASAPGAPLNVYGASKLAGETATINSTANAAVVRTAWVHSGGGVNFIATAVRVLRKGTVMRVVDDQISTPTRAAHLASALWRVAGATDIRGLHHFTDAGVASWYDVADCVLETMRTVGAAGEGAAVLPVDSSVFPRPAQRPRVSLLDKHATWSALGTVPPHWRVGVVASTQELLKHT